MNIECGHNNQHLENKSLTAMKTKVPLLLSGMVNKDDYVGDLPFVYGYSDEERLCLRTALWGITLLERRYSDDSSADLRN